MYKKETDIVTDSGLDHQLRGPLSYQPLLQRDQAQYKENRIIKGGETDTMQ